MRVALVASSYHPYIGGVEEHVRSVARELRAVGHEVVVWTVDRGEHFGTGEHEGVEVRYLPTPLPARSFGAVGRFLAAAPRAARAWRRAARAFRPDIIHVQCFGPNGVYALAVSAITRRPLVVTSHGETFADDHGVFDSSAILRKALRLGVRRAAVVTGCSTAVLDDLAARFGLENGRVVPNGVDTAGPPPLRERREPPVVVGVGRVERMKGFDLLLDAFAEADVPDTCELVIAGDGAMRPALGARADKLGIAHRVGLPGMLSRSEVAALMASAAVVVVPSRREAFGMVVLEAWHAGVPLVVTSRGGPAQLVTDGVDGLVADPDDTGALGCAIGKVVGDPGLGESLAAAGRVTVRGYTWQHVAALYIAAYEECVGR
jgi:glycogen synthase